MRKFINFIKRLLTYTVLFLLITLLIFTIYTFVYSKIHNISMRNTLSYIKSLYSQIFDFNFDNKDSDTILTDTSLADENLVISTNNAKNKYYYEQLDDTSKIIYTTLENNINNLKKENYIIDFSTTFNDLLHTSTGNYRLNKSFQSALDAFFYDYPELFYIDISKISLVITAHSLGPLTTYVVSLAPQNSTNYLNDEFNNENEVDIAISKIENTRNNIIKSFNSESDYDKILQIHNILVNSLEYNSSITQDNTHNIYGAFIQKSVVCEGYSKALKYILDSLDIECILISGTATNSSNETDDHMWNYIKLGDNWYGIDVTWDDPIVIGGPSTNTLRHDYFLKGSKTFIYSHKPNGKISDNGMLFSLPTLSSKNYQKK